ncbi:hypothetical protein SDRG_03415, partial [Saprolegnia diclina VS20]
MKAHIGLLFAVVATARSASSDIDVRAIDTTDRTDSLISHASARNLLVADSDPKAASDNPMTSASGPRPAHIMDTDFSFLGNNGVGAPGSPSNNGGGASVNNSGDVSGNNGGGVSGNNGGGASVNNGGGVSGNNGGGGSGNNGGGVSVNNGGDVSGNNGGGVSVFNDGGTPGNNGGGVSGSPSNNGGGASGNNGVGASGNNGGGVSGSPSSNGGGVSGSPGNNGGGTPGNNGGGTPGSPSNSGGGASGNNGVGASGNNGGGVSGSPSSNGGGTPGSPSMKDLDAPSVSGIGGGYKPVHQSDGDRSAWRRGDANGVTDTRGVNRPRGVNGYKGGHKGVKNGGYQNANGNKSVIKEANLKNLKYGTNNIPNEDIDHWHDSADSAANDQGGYIRNESSRFRPSYSDADNESDDAYHHALDNDYDTGYDSHDNWWHDHIADSNDATPSYPSRPSPGHEYPNFENASDDVYDHFADSDDECPFQPCHQLETIEYGKCVYRQLAPGTLCAGQSCDNGGPCDDDEKDYCDSDGTCVNGYRIETYVPCRPAVSACDVPEYCNGKQSECPVDKFSPRTQKCIGHSNGGDCDTTDHCDGRGHCVDGFRGSSFVCRAARDACDAPEHCTGHSGMCPHNRFADKSTDCTGMGRSSKGPCDARDRCDGKGNCIDRYHGPDHICRKPRDECDVPEYCTGDSRDCPDDEFADTSVTCSGASSHGACDSVDYCDGHGNCIDQFLDSDHVCRKERDVCDLPEYCTGVHGSCPRNEFASAGTVCTPIGASSNGPCDAIDYCDGRGTCVDNYNVDTLCYDPRGFCESGRFCNGASGACPAAGYGHDYVLLADDASMTEVVMHNFRMCSAKVAEGLVSVDGTMPSHSVFVLLASVALVAVVVAIVVTKGKPMSSAGNDDGYVLVTENV